VAEPVIEMKGPPIPGIRPREYQLPVFKYWEGNKKPDQRAVECWARRLGKDLTYMSVAASKVQFERKGLYVHFLPEAEHARRTIWDGFTNEGDRLIDVAFPPVMRSKTLDHDMRIEFKDGGAWQLGGSDQYDRWVGSNPIGIVYSEFALAHPRGWDLMRPILKINGGWAAFISTPRGYNHFFQILQLAKENPGWRWSHINALEAMLDDGNPVMTQFDIDEEVRQGMPEELARQEYLCDFSAANVGAILGRQVERADKDGRLRDEVYDAAGERIDVSLDLGFRDTAAAWFWQRWHDTHGLVDYDEDNGLDAEQWIQRLADKPWHYGTIYLPHDARAKTFQTRHTVLEQFAAAIKDGRLNAERAVLVPMTSISDRINAARTVMPYCRFDRVACAQGLLTLREWQYKYDDARKTYSREPEHNWASHGGDAFSYGAQMMRFSSKSLTTKRVQGPVNWADARDPRHIIRPTLADMWAEREHEAEQRNRIP
jgi:hypothetical protein